MENKTQRVIKGLRNAILAGKYQVNEKLPTESALMKQYEVSRYTIRQAVGALVNDHFVYRIQGGGMYVQDWRESRSQDRNRHLIGVISTHIADYIFPKIIYGIDQVISDAGYSLLISNTHNDQRKERQSLLSMLEMNVAGLIIEPTQSALANPNLALYEEIKVKKIPVVFINAIYPSLDFPAVTTNDTAAEEQLINYLISLGHERILGIFQIDDLQGVHRMNGFVQAYQQHAALATKSILMMYQSSDHFEKLATNLVTALAQPEPPTAIAWYNDQLAIRVIASLKDQGWQVPTDLSVVGFDNYQVGQYLSPSLTTMNHEKEGMGTTVGQLMIRSLAQQSVQSVQFEPQLIVRQSTTTIKK